MVSGQWSVVSFRTLVFGLRTLVFGLWSSGWVWVSVILSVLVSQQSSASPTPKAQSPRPKTQDPRPRLRLRPQN